MIPNEKNLQSRLHFPDLKTDLHFYHEGGGIYYELLHEKRPLFTGADYKPPACDPFSIPSMVVLLSGLIYPSENAEEEYTGDQTAWLKSIGRDDLASYVNKYDAGERKDQIAAEAYFKRSYTRYIHEDIFTLNDVVGKAPKGRIYMTARQRKNLRNLFMKSRLKETTLQKIDAAIEDGFSKMKKDDTLEAILFNGDQVTFKGKRHYIRELSNITKRIICTY